MGILAKVSLFKGKGFFVKGFWPFGPVGQIRKVFCLGHVNLIVSLPSGPQPGNRPSLPPEKKTGPEKQTAAGRKKQMPPLHGASLPPARKTNKCPQQRKIHHKGQIPLWSDPRRPQAAFFPPLPASQPGSAQEIVPPSRQKRKQAQKNKPPWDEKNKFAFVFFFPPPDGKLTIKFTCP